jgi:hypothetical protein
LLNAKPQESLIPDGAQKVKLSNKACGKMRNCLWRFNRRTFNESKKMKLPIKQKYFEQIKRGEKTVEYRDAHITFVCEETRETLRKNISVVNKEELSQGLMRIGMFEDNKIIVFELK